MRFFAKLIIILVVGFFSVKYVYASNYIETFDDNVQNTEFWSYVPNNVIYEQDGTIKYAKLSVPAGQHFFPYFKSVDLTELKSNYRSLDFTVKLSDIGINDGAGYLISDVLPDNGESLNFNNIMFYIWPTGDGHFHLFSTICPRDNQECNPLTHRLVMLYSFPENSGWHLINVKRVDEHYVISIDGNDVYTTVDTQRVVSRFAIGSPELRISGSQDWPILYIDFVGLDTSLNEIVSTFPYLSQKDPAWGGEEYDTASGWAGSNPNTIGRWGCALTSVAMVLKNYDIKSPTDGTETNPLVLNNWLKSQSDGYIRGGLLNWLAVARYAKLSQAAGHSPTALEFTKSNYDSGQVDTLLNEGSPSILGTTDHFIVAYKAETDHYDLADPDNATRSAELKNFPFITANTYHKSNTDLSYFLFVKELGMDVTLTNQAGGSIPLQFQTEFPDNTIETAYLPKILGGKYTLKLTGKSADTGRFDAFLYDVNGNVKQQTLEVPEAGELWYEINFDSTDSSKSAMIELDKTPPPVPEQLTPASGSLVRAAGLILDWSDVTDPSGPVTYKYKSSWTGGNYGPVSTGTASQINASGSADRTYLWQVQACDTAGNCSEWSNGFSITIDGTKPVAPTITKPAEGQYFKTAPIANEWTSLTDNSGIREYRVQYEYDDGHQFSGYPYRTTTSTSRNHMPTIQEQGGVKYRVQGIDKAGNEGDWSEWRHYYYDATAPIAPSILSPTPNPTSGETQNWGWNAASDNLSVKGYYSQYYDVLGESFSNWFWLGNVLKTSSNLAEGKWQLLVKAEDQAGNQSQVSTSNVLTVDTTAPATPTNLKFHNPELSCGAITNKNMVTIDWNDSYDANGPVKYEYNINYPLATGNGRGNWTTTFATSQYRGSLNIGLHIIKIRAYDPAGNYSSWSGNCEITYDPVAPLSVITSPVNSLNGDSIITNNWDGSIIGTATDSVGIAWVELSIKRGSDGKYWNGIGWVEGTETTTRVSTEGTTNWNYLLNSPTDDSYTIISHAVDLAGNVENSYKLEVVLDTTIPEIELKMPAFPSNTNGWYYDQPGITLLAVDKHLNKVEYKWGEGNDWQIYAGTVYPAQEGANTLYYQAYDLAGNYSATGIKQVKWDMTKINKAPKITSFNLTNDNKNGTVSWEAAEDNVGIDKYEVQWWKDSAYKYTKAVSGGTRQAEIDTLSDGSWVVVVRAFDGPGNTAEDSRNFTIGSSSGGVVLGETTLTAITSPNPLPSYKPSPLPIASDMTLANANTNNVEETTETGEVLGEETSPHKWYWLILVVVITSGGYLLWKRRRA